MVHVCVCVCVCVTNRPGLEWSVGAISNATWTGARLRDVLLGAGIATGAGSQLRHVQFEGLDKDMTGATYGASIPIAKALDEGGDVLLAYAMNGEPIPRDHGYPVRVVVPGHVGARSVTGGAWTDAMQGFMEPMWSTAMCVGAGPRPWALAVTIDLPLLCGCWCVQWVSKITAAEGESQSFWQQHDYKVLSPSVDWDGMTAAMKAAPAMQEMPVQSAVASPASGSTIPGWQDDVEVKGYAWSGGGRPVVRVDVTADGGKSWTAAELSPHPVDASSVKNAWGWTLWSATVPVPVDAATGAKPDTVRVCVKASDVASNTQVRTPVLLHSVPSVAVSTSPMLSCLLRLRCTALASS